MAQRGKDQLTLHEMQAECCKFILQDPKRKELNNIVSFHLNVVISRL